MNERQWDSIIDVLGRGVDAMNRFCVAYERHVHAIERQANIAKRAGRKQPKEGALAVRGHITSFKGPNNYGFYDVIIGKDKYSTKRGDIAGVCGDAYASDSEVELSYSEKKNESKGEVYTNRYIESVEILSSTQVSGSGSAVEKPALPLDKEEDEEAPF
jgi:hypothetical protein